MISCQKKWDFLSSRCVREKNGKKSRLCSSKNSFKNVLQ